MSTDAALQRAQRSESAFRERLWPGVGTLLGLSVFMLGLILVVVPVGPRAAAAWAIIVLALAIAAVVSSSAVIAVEGDALRAGRARIPWTVVGELTALDASARRAALGPELDSRAYLCVRGWITTAVKVSVSDPDDPTPYWIVSTRHPEALIQAAHSRQTA